MFKNIAKNGNFSLDNICYLQSNDIQQDEIGNCINKLPMEKLCFCAERPAFSNEFFAAAQQGIKSQLILIINSENYDGEEKVRYNEVVYSIYRTYPKDDGLTELYLTLKAGD